MTILRCLVKGSVPSCRVIIDIGVLVSDTSMDSIIRHSVSRSAAAGVVVIQYQCWGSVIPGLERMPK